MLGIGGSYFTKPADDGGDKLMWSVMTVQDGNRAICASVASGSQG